MTRRWTWLPIASVAFVAILGVTAQAQVSPRSTKSTKEAPEQKQGKEEKGYSSARSVIGSFKELSKKHFTNPSAPTKDEVTLYFNAAFERIGEYLDASPEAKDRETLYHWARGVKEHGYGQEGFIKLGRQFLADKPKAPDRDEWHLAVILACLGSEKHSKDALEELKKLESECPDTDTERVISLYAVRLEHACRARNDGDRDKLTAGLLKHPAVVANKKPALERKLVRVVMGTNQAAVKVGTKFPDWADVMPIKDMAGKEVKMSDYKGKVVLIDFWATWYRPCLAEMPKLAKLYAEKHAKGFEIIGVCMDVEESEEYVRDYLNADGKSDRKRNYRDVEITWRQIFDGGRADNGLGRRYGVTYLPYNILIDSQGRVAETGLRGDELAEKVNHLLGLADKDATEKTTPQDSKKPDVKPDDDEQY